MEVARLKGVSFGNDAKYEGDVTEVARDFFLKGKAICKRAMWGLFSVGPLLSWIYVSQ